MRDSRSEEKEKGGREKGERKKRRREEKKREECRKVEERVNATKVAGKPPPFSLLAHRTAE